MRGKFLVLADDDPFNLDLLQTVCREEGHRVAIAADGNQLLEIVARERPDLILLDVMMPVLDGFEVLKVLRTQSEMASIPVILVTAANDADSRERGIELGATDYVTKPYRIFEIKQRIRNALRLDAAETKARLAGEQLRHLDSLDPLTQVGSSQQLWLTASYEFTRAARYRHPLTAMVVTLRGLGESVQAQAQVEGLLVELASGLRACLRTVDHVFRTDDDQFTLLLPETNADGANALSTRIMDSTRTAFFSSPPPGIALSVSSATGPLNDIQTAEDLLRAARG